MPGQSNPHNRTRVSSYQARIERSLTDIFFEVPEHERVTRSVEGTRWTLVSTGHTQGFAQCELCGHVPIRRLFWIAPVTVDDENADMIDESRMMMIGSECAQNYVRVDLVQAYMRRLERRQSEVRRTRQHEERDAERQSRREAIEVERRAWPQNNGDIIMWLSRAHHLVDRRRMNVWLTSTHGRVPTEPVPTDNFLRSLAEQVRNQSYLTEGQTRAARHNMEAWQSWYNALTVSERTTLRRGCRVLAPQAQEAVSVADEQELPTAASMQNSMRVVGVQNENEIADLLTAGLIARETDEPATQEDAPGILNGNYTLTTGHSEYHYQIYTVQRSRTAPDLNGKRIIKAYDNESGTYKGFAYLTKSGHVRVWRRHLPRASEPIFQYANTLMAILREMPMDHQDVYTRSYNERRWTINRNSSCRHCNDAASRRDRGLCPEHAGQAIMSGDAEPITVNITPPRVADRGSRRTRSEQTERRVALLLDELGQGEVR